MSDAKQGDTVKVHYTGTLGDGTIFDSSIEREPLQFTLGKRQLIKGFEDAVIGMSVGETKSVSIPSEEAYGSRREEFLLKYTKADFPPNVEPKEGLVINLVNQDGRSIFATITEISGDAITADANHPLAGKDLTFKIDLVDIA
ncbi:MAG: peptidylprolyl isomerase [Nitrospirae bacterium RBG_13_43_8]|nr:MAG: peptidylprolyl isomerase [Nitrospirae bacterium RBG_13_43_8]